MILLGGDKRAADHCICVWEASVLTLQMCVVILRMKSCVCRLFFPFSAIFCVPRKVLSVCFHLVFQRIWREGLRKTEDLFYILFKCSCYDACSFFCLFFSIRIYCVCSDGTEIQIMCSNVVNILICSYLEENIMPTFN